MAPPTKRRRLFFWQSEEVMTDSSALDIASPHVFEHAVTQIEPAPQTTPSIQEVHVQVKNSLFADLRRRQVVNVDVAVGVSDSVVSSATPSSSSTSTLTTTSASTDSSSATQAGSVSTSSVSSTSTQSSSTTGTSSEIRSSVTTISPASSATFTTISSSQNLTVAENILTSNLSTSSTSRFASSSFISYSNSSISSTSSDSPDSSSTDTSTDTSTDDPSSTDNVAVSTVYTVATLSSDGQPISTITSAVVVGYGAPPPASSTSASLASGGGSGNSTPPPPGTIAGGVVGGAAGLAVLLLAAMLLLRWYRRRAQLGHTALLQSAPNTYSDNEPGLSRDSPGMAERAGMRPWAAAVPAIFRHQPSHAAISPVAGSERSFQRVSGRKLPSAFSPGMESAPPIPQRAGHVPAAMPYRDNVQNPFSDRPGSHSPEDLELNRQPSDEQMTMVQGPQRRPTIHTATPPTVDQHMDGLRPRHASAIARTSGGIDFGPYAPEPMNDHMGEVRMTQFREEL